MTSYTESFGLVLIEAMSYGIPCIAFDSAEGAREIIVNDKNGFLISNRNIKEYVDRLNLMAENKDLLKVFGKEAKKTSLKYQSASVKKMWDDVLTNKV